MNVSLPLEVFLFPLLGFLLYGVCLSGTAVFDDLEVLPNAEKFPLKWETWRQCARPWTNTVMALLMKWPRTTRGIHVFNILLHSVNAFLLSRIAFILTGDRVGGMAAGMFFMAMPLAANTVAYMSGQAGLWVGMFGLLGVLAILSGWGWLSLLALAGCYLAKEDGLGFALTFFLLLIYKDAFWTAGVFLLFLIVGVRLRWPRLYRLMKGTGDKEMAAIGLPVSLPQPLHGFTVFVETVRRLPFWFFGAKQSPYHGSGIEIPRWTKTLAAIAVLLAFASLLYR